jgi:hypothetical protein
LAQMIQMIDTALPINHPVIIPGLLCKLTPEFPGRGNHTLHPSNCRT